MSRETLKMALEFMNKRVTHWTEGKPDLHDMKVALRAALAEPDEEPEPAAHMYPSDLERFETNETYAHAFSVAVGNPDEESVPLYRHPPGARHD